MRKTIKVDELPEDAIIMTDHYIFVGTGKSAQQEKEGDTK